MPKSMTESDISVASTKVNADSNSSPPSSPPGSPRSSEPLTPKRQALAHAAETTSVYDFLLFLIAFRVLNALIIKTFFQPDEYFQALEPAWRMVFGEGSGAWITWEWKNGLRSSIHPSLFALSYAIGNGISWILRLGPSNKAAVILAAPKTLQALFAGLADYYTWQLSRRIYGHNTPESWSTLLLTALSPWSFFCATRTLSNSLEVFLTIAPLVYWPAQWSLIGRKGAEYDDKGLRMRAGAKELGAVETKWTRLGLSLAALACILRPTNGIVWTVLAGMTCLSVSKSGWLAKAPWSQQRMWIEFSSLSLNRATAIERKTLFTEAARAGATLLTISVIADRLFYHFWAFPPAKFLYYNIVQNLAVFYGRNPWHYYLTQGLPLLLTTALPFALIGGYQSLTSRVSAQDPLQGTMLAQLATISCVMISVLSLISHKEVRFIYPLLPLLHVLASKPVARFFGPSLIRPLSSRLSPPNALPRRALLALLILINLTIAIYTTTVHNRGVIDVMNYLRERHEDAHIPKNTTLTAGFLMPCHSTPWRSHLVHRDIHAWALTCEPPLNLTRQQKLAYVDEADAFYADPTDWVRRHMSRQPPRLTAQLSNSKTTHDDQIPLPPGSRRTWPEYLIFFEQAEKTLTTILRGSGYVECWRGFNSHWHDDWRRRGDVVVWCLDPTAKSQGKSKRNGKVVDAVDQKQQVKVKTKTKPKTKVVKDNVLGGAVGPWGIGRGRADPEPRTATGTHIETRAKTSAQTPLIQSNLGLGLGLGRLSTWFKTTLWPWSKQEQEPRVWEVWKIWKRKSAKGKGKGGWGGGWS